MKDTTIILDHILESGKRILVKTKGVDFATFIQDQDLIDIVIRNLEIVGEACRAVPEEFRDKYSQIKWTRPTSLRNVLIHEYFQVDLGMLWNIVKDDLPGFVKQVEEVIEKEKAV